MANIVNPDTSANIPLNNELKGTSANVFKPAEYVSKACPKKIIDIDIANNFNGLANFISVIKYTNPKTDIILINALKVDNKGNWDIIYKDAAIEDIAILRKSNDMATPIIFDDLILILVNAYNIIKTEVKFNSALAILPNGIVDMYSKLDADFFKESDNIDIAILKSITLNIALLFMLTTSIALNTANIVVITTANLIIPNSKSCHLIDCKVTIILENVDEI